MVFQSPDMIFSEKIRKSGKRKSKPLKERKVIKKLVKVVVKR